MEPCFIGTGCESNTVPSFWQGHLENRTWLTLPRSTQPALAFPRQLSDPRHRSPSSLSPLRSAAQMRTPQSSSQGLEQGHPQNRPYHCCSCYQRLGRGGGTGVLRVIRFKSQLRSQSQLPANVPGKVMDEGSSLPPIWEIQMELLVLAPGFGLVQP